MRDFKQTIVLFILSFCISGCSFPIQLIIANNSQEEVIVKYTFPTTDKSPYLSRHPSTYAFDENLNKLGKKKFKNKISSLQSSYSLSEDSTKIRIILKPRQAVHIGYYPSFLNRDVVLSNYQVMVEVGNGKVANFEHLKYSYSEILTIK